MPMMEDCCYGNERYGWRDGRDVGKWDEVDRRCGGDDEQYHGDDSRCDGR